jgi:recombination protein RecR
MSELDTLIQLLARLPGLGPRSARRAALHLIKRRESLLEPLAAALAKRRKQSAHARSAAISIR